METGARSDKLSDPDRVVPMEPLGPDEGGIVKRDETESLRRDHLLTDLTITLKSNGVEEAVKV